MFFTVIIYGFAKNGLVSSSCSCRAASRSVILPLVVLIEVFSFFSRPISHSVRLFANMLAGHITLKVFAGFVIMLGALRHRRLARRGAAARHGGRADRARIAGRVPAGLRLHHPHLHLSQRRIHPGH